MVIHSNDKYFYGSDGFSKNRESVVVATNNEKQVALVKLTTSDNPKYRNVKNYNGSRYMTEDIYIKDNEDNPIFVKDSKKVDSQNKFVKSYFRDVPLDSVNEIKNTLVSNSKYGKRNFMNLEKLKKRKQ